MNTREGAPDFRFAAALSTQADTGRAIEEVTSQALAQLQAAPSLAMVFVSSAHAAGSVDISKILCAALQTENLLGCSGESIVGGPREIEDQPAIALWLARLPGVSLHTMHLDFQRTAEGGTVAGWPDNLPETWPAGAALLLLGEPFSFPADWLLERLNEDRPGLPVIGGMASAGHQPGQNRLYLGRSAHTAGAVAALIHGPVAIRSIVSQGCRPIGRAFVVTKADRNMILELSGKPALAQLQELWHTLDAQEQSLVQAGLHVGRVINEYQDKFGRGDFLVRNVMGADAESGAIVIGDYVRPGQTVQFHVRDAQTADEDLRALVASAAPLENGRSGALLFTCNGRGTRLFEQPHHDAGTVAGLLGNLPLAGFFAQGELGPVGGKNFIHGFTASLALFSPRAETVAG